MVSLTVFQTGSGGLGDGVAYCLGGLGDRVAYGLGG
jgi:hypothetical protein